MAEENNEINIENEAIPIEDSEDSKVSDADRNNIIPFIMEKYNRAEDYREQDEQRWLRAYRNYRGLYGSDIQIKSRLKLGRKKYYFNTHLKNGYKTTRGFIFGDVYYDTSECTGTFQIYPYIFATKYILNNSQDLVRGHRNFGPHIHEDLLKNCPDEHKFEIKKEHLVGL